MKKRGKKLLSCIIAFSLLAGLFVTLQPLETEAAKIETLYQENFEDATIASLEEQGWKGLTQYDMPNGALRGRNRNAYYANADAYNWTDYTYETKMTMVTKNADNTVDGFFGICFGVNSSGAGLEYGIRYKSSDNSFTYRVYDRVNKKFLIAETSLADKAAMDTEMTLKVKVEGASFTIYLNDEVLKSATASENITGTVGTLMSANTIYLLYDDMSVTQAVEPVETVNTLLLETFASKSQPSNWQAISSAAGNYAEGALRLPNGTASSAHYKGQGDTAYTWKNYSYSALLQFEELPTTYSGGDWNGITFGRASSSANALEFGLNYNPNTGVWTYRVYDRRNADMVVAASNVPSSIAIRANEPIEMKATVDGKNVAVYLNGVRLAIETVKTEVTGTVGLLKPTAGTLIFDDLHVISRDYGTEDKTVISTGDVSSKADGDTPFAEENGWFADYADYTTEGGMIKLVSQANQKAYPMSRYITDGYISADVKIEKPESLADGTYYPVQLTTRNTTIYASDNYEARVRFVAKKDSESYTNTVQAVIYSGGAPIVLALTGWEFDTMYCVKLLCIGNCIEVVIQDDTNAILAERTYPLEEGNGLIDRAGAFGIQSLHGAKIPAYVNNVEVHQFRPYTITDAAELAEVAAVKQSNTVSVTPSKFYAGEMVTVNVTGAVAAGGLTYVTQTGGMEKNIFAQPEGTERGKGAGNVFVFKMPADNVTLQTKAYTDAKDSMASVASSLAEDGRSIRFLNRVYLPDIYGDKAFVSDKKTTYGGKEYTILECGAIVLPTDLIPEGENLTLDTARIAKVLMTGESFKLYDRTTEYLDFTVKLVNLSNSARSYSVRAFITLQSGDEVITLYGNTLEQSIDSLKGAY